MLFGVVLRSHQSVKGDNETLDEGGMSELQDKVFEVVRRAMRTFLVVPSEFDRGSPVCLCHENIKTLLPNQVTTEYGKAHAMVSDQVLGLVTVLDKMMGSHDDDDDE